MNQRILARTGWAISELSFGCMSLQGTDAENARLIHKAIDGGINYFDTADLYQGGANETTVGKALIGKRSEVYIATKVGNELRADGSGWDWNPRKSYILKAVDQSLSRLQTDYIDLYQLHGGTIEDPIDEVIEAFEQLKEQGKIRAYGISSIRPNVIREYVDRAQIVSNMMQYSLLDRRPEEEALGLLEKNEVGVMVRGALAKGYLAGKPVTDYLGYKSQSIDNLIEMMNIFSIEKTNLSHMALQWVLSHQAVATAVVGIRTEAQLDDVLAYAEASRLSKDQLSQLSSVLPAFKYEKHR